MPAHQHNLSLMAVDEEQAEPTLWQGVGCAAQDFVLFKMQFWNLEKMNNRKYRNDYFIYLDVTM